MLEKREGIVTMGGAPVTLVGKEIKLGDKGENFTALKTDLSEYSLEDAADKIKIISAVPSLDTPVCELQTIRFNELASELEGVEILTLSMDLPFAQERFCGAKGIENLTTLSDHRYGDFAKKYGLLMEELRLLARAIIILDKDNTIKYIEIVEEATNHPDYDKALEEVKKLI